MLRGTEPNFRQIFESGPAPYLILDPNFTIVAVNNAYLAATMTKRADIEGKYLFDVFPDNPLDPNADGVKNLTASLNQVLQSKVTHTMAVQKYDIPRRDGSKGFDERWWRPQNSPILDPNGEVMYIVHHVEDVTNMIDVLGDALNKASDNNAAQDKP